MQTPPTKSTIVFNNDIIPRLSQSSFRAYLITMQSLCTLATRPSRAIFRGHRLLMRRVAHLRALLLSQCLEGACPGSFCSARPARSRRGRSQPLGAQPALGAERIDHLSENYRVIAVEFLRSFDVREEQEGGAGGKKAGGLEGNGEEKEKMALEEASDIVIKESFLCVWGFLGGFGLFYTK